MKHLATRRRAAGLAVTLLVLFAAAEVQAACGNRYVATTGADGVNDCLTSGAPCLTIQHAIGQACSGDAVNVAVGTYVETGQIVINKSLTLVGAGAGSTVIKPSGDTGSSGDARGWFLVDSGNTFNLSGVTLDGSGFKIWQAIRHKGQGTANNCAFTNIQYEASGPSYAGTAIAAFGTGNVHVTGSTFSQIGRVGVLYYGSTITGSVFSGNRYTGKGTGDFLDYAVEVGAGARASITGNTIDDNGGVASVDSSLSAGMLVTTYYGSGTQATVSGNIISDTQVGIYVGYDAFDTSSVSAHFNHLSGGVQAGVQTTAPFVDAEANYWDDPTGPTIASNPAGAGEAASGDVDYSPWLKDGTDTDTGAPGFQWVVPTVFVVNPNASPSYVDGGIQNGVDFASAGDTVEAVAGTYVEVVDITKPLTARGQAGAIIQPDNGTALLDGGVRRPAVYASGVDGVHVETFDIDGTGGTVHYGVYFLNSNDSFVTGNVIHDIQNDLSDVAGTGILLFGWGQGVDGARIEDNVVSYTGRMGIFVGGLDGTGTTWLSSTGNVIGGNTVHHAWQGPTSDGGGAVQINAGVDSSIEDGTIHDTGLGQRAIYLAVSASGVSVAGNTIDHPGTAPAIQHYACCGGTSDDLSITGNVITIDVPGTDGVAVNPGEVGGASLFSGNTVTLTGTAPPSFYHGLDLGGAGTGGWTVSSNVFAGNLMGPNSAGIRLRGSLPATSTVAITCNRIQEWAYGIRSDALANAALVNAADNSFLGNSVNGMLDGGSSTAITAENNWWGCTGGPGDPACNTVSGNVDADPWAISVPACVNCTADSQCDDFDVCTGPETCNLLLSICQPGTPLDCDDTNSCTVDSCDPSSGCINDGAPRENFACNDGQLCTLVDTCLSGVCTGTVSDDTDGDGYCDFQEAAAGCSTTDPKEIPPQANVYSGGRAGPMGGAGELLMTYRSPKDRKVKPSTDISCAAAGLCTNGFCSQGKIGDPCGANTDCNQPITKCRVIINYAEVPGLVLKEAKFKVRGSPDQNVLADFQPATAGCSRKVDISLTTGFKRARLRLKAEGTVGTAKRRDGDRLIFLEQ